MSALSEWLERDLLVLQKARAIIVKGWTRGDYYTRRSTGYHGYCFCMLGAARLASTEVYRGRVDWKQKHAIVKAVIHSPKVTVAGSLQRAMNVKFPEWAGRNLGSFNDSNTKGNVLKVFDEAIRQAKSQLQLAREADHG